ncbi:glutamine/asparagine-rich protein mdt-30-like [Scophthalmus maximus]|uniref:glutamine/asparagine-rich protein mdt-30-like n=1 Tax=Scophthalmus maximus TaxID=52904 RepID=UPI0015E07CE8|nr:glutamine/asparagine-rich protein mdt-30-like [Scophthalmus maximus]
MITVSLLSCLAVIASAVPVNPNVRPPVPSQGGAPRVHPVEATNQKPEAQTPALLSPSVERPQSGVPQQLGPQGGPQPVPSVQHYNWPPLGGSVMMIPLQLGVHGPQHANQPLMFPSYGYFPLFSPPYRNQPSSPYGFQIILEAPLPQTPANQPPHSQVLPAQTPPEAAPPGAAPQPVQQQQNSQIVYMLQQPKSSPLGSLSSEELEMAARMGQLGVYVATVIANPPAGAVQTGSQAAGLTNQRRAGVVPTAVTSSARVPQTQGPATGPQLSTSTVPVGLERVAQEATTAQTPVQPQLQPTQGNHF